MPNTKFSDFSADTIGASGDVVVGLGPTDNARFPVGTTPAASTVAAWNASVNMSANNFLAGYATTATAAGTTVLTVTSARLQYFTGATTQTVTLPVTSTLVLGHQYCIYNNSTGVVTVQSSGANEIRAMEPGTLLVATCILTSGTDAASWSAWYSDADFVFGYTTTATAAGTTVLTNSSTYNQYFTGATTQTVTLPVTSTLVLGKQYRIVNDSTGIVTIESSGANTLVAMDANTQLLVTCILTSGTGTASWSWSYLAWDNLLGNVIDTGITAPSIAFSTTSGVIGTTTNDSAAAGSVGEMLSTIVLIGSAVGLTTATPADIATINLTAGDWDVWGEVWTAPDAGTLSTNLVAAISDTTATLPTIPATSTSISAIAGVATGAGEPLILSTGACRVSVAAPTTYYLVTSATFTVSTLGGYGVIYARRRR